jgi:hypothetical protein
VADLGRDPFAEDHRADDHQQNQRHLGPVELGDGGDWDSVVPLLSWPMPSEAWQGSNRVISYRP